MSSPKICPELAQLLERGPLPTHIAVIMDGNGRWAKQQGKSRVFGHKAGVHSVRDITECCAELGVKYLTLYTFSTENWNRPAMEVNALMHLLIRALKKEAQTFHKNDIRLRSIGDTSQLPEACQAILQEVVTDTAEYSRMTLTLALSYSGRWEILDGVRKLMAQVSSGGLAPEDVTEEKISAAFNSNFLPDPDLLIRTGGEQRISNFLLWQIAYSELFFSPVYWPDFRKPHLIEAIESYQDRDRRFGRVRETT